jgi:hypothetical protein
MLRVSLALAVTSMFLAACGGGSDSGGPSATAPVAVAPGPSVAPVAGPTPTPVLPPVVVTPTTNDVTTPLAGANVRLTKGLPVSAAVCGQWSSLIGVSGQMNVLWKECSTAGLPIKNLNVGTATKQISLEYGNLEIGIVRFGSESNDINSTVEVDTVNRIIKFKHASLPLTSFVTGIGGVLPTQVQTIAIDGELKY